MEQRTAKAGEVSSKKTAITVVLRSSIEGIEEVPDSPEPML